MCAHFFLSSLQRVFSFHRPSRPSRRSQETAAGFRHGSSAKSPRHLASRRHQAPVVPQSTISIRPRCRSKVLSTVTLAARRVHSRRRSRPCRVRSRRCRRGRQRSSKAVVFPLVRCSLLYTYENNTCTATAPILLSFLSCVISSSTIHSTYMDSEAFVSSEVLDVACDVIPHSLFLILT